MIGGQRAQPEVGEHVGRGRAARPQRPPRRPPARPPTAASRAASPHRARCVPSPSSAIVSRAPRGEPPAQRGGALRPAAAGVEPRERVERGDGGRLAVGVGDRRLRRRCRPAARSPRPPDAAATGGDRVAPALLLEPARRRAAARSGRTRRRRRARRPSQPAAARHARLQLGGERRVAERREHDEEPARRVRGAVVEQRAVAHGPAVLGEPRPGHGPVLVRDLARLLVGLGIVDTALARRERAQRRARHLRRRRQDLQRA